MKDILAAVIFSLLVIFLLVGIVAGVLYMDAQTKNDRNEKLNSLKTLTIPEKLDRIIIDLEKLK